ncbi:MAG: FAD-dependent oxidoreductase, partial [Chloroflexota bacterium]|nr:FAD-dependent oxidoreductase [Chloroflexota bacterium]
MHVTITGGGMIGLTSAYQMARGGAIARAPGSFFRDWTSTTDPRVGAGVRPMTPDGLPIMGKLPNLENAWVSTGHAMLGITLAPASATAI